MSTFQRCGGFSITVGESDDRYTSCTARPFTTTSRKAGRDGAHDLVGGQHETRRPVVEHTVGHQQITEVAGRAGYVEILHEGA
jgi:hypothetical protein